MVQAIWNEEIIAESSDTVIVEGNHYFPASAVKPDFLQASEHHTHCPWKGDASYYHLRVKGKTNENAAWYYKDPFPKARHIEGRIAFWKGVTVREKPDSP
ncbi:MAG: DUF427 domain-containing protein [Spirochaetales bacterium]|nr:DUF427 domain-containing protein [Spirochaetales bacterium]